MALSFQAFLQDKVEPELAQQWEASYIEKVEVSSARRWWTMRLRMSRPLQASCIAQTEAALKKHYPYLDGISILPDLENNPACIAMIIAARKDDLSSLFFSASHQPKDIDLLQWKVGHNRIDLMSEQAADFQIIIDNDTCSQLANWFWQEYRLRVLVRVLCREQNPIAKDSVTLIQKQAVETISHHTAEPVQKRRSFSRDKKLAQVISSQPQAVADLQEGMKTAVIEGEIWNKESTTLKDGRQVRSYYLTDYTDSIVIKAFFDDAKEDQIDVGDCIRVKGGVRFDPFLKEVAMFMDAYSKVPKQKRQDQSPEKRIELHAHTKMSAMDGLTEVADLVKTAAAWGHTALAITDHGCTQAFPIAYDANKALKERAIKIIYGVEGYLVDDDKKGHAYHIILLACNREGLKNLYKLVSNSYLHHFYRKPRMLREDLQQYREGILLGTACEAGELYQAILAGADEETIINIAGFYDYLEIQPTANNYFLIKQGRVESEQALQEMNKTIVALGKQLNKPVVATGDVHFLEPHHDIYRNIIQAGQGYEDADAQAPLYFKTTEEMLADFAYLGEAQARAVVIENPALISSMIENIKPVPDGFYPPKIDTAEQEIIALSWQNAHARYGEQLPPMVEQRVKRELDSITTHGFAVLYLIAHKLVKKSNEDGYLVGSRGSVGSSMVAFLTGITEVNSLPPHYLCPNCYYHEFFTEGQVGCGADLEDKPCPQCGSALNKDGFDIPFETFLGFDGDKTPDIDLNFSGDYQSRAHQYVEELFGSENVFRAGTIATVADKTAFGFVKKYAEEKELILKNTEISRLAKGITGVRRTTGQHPGGLIVVPRDHDILEFTPLQHPADNAASGIVTTHFEYHAIGDQLVKLDILGHDDPTVIKELEDLTGVKANTISLSEKETMRIFSGVEPLGVEAEEIDSSVGTYGIPEFGTRFVRQMLEATRPTTFSELVRISGLSHGTDVWLNNAQTLIENQTATLSEVICTRDDIMTYLIQQGLEKKQAFKIMENVRKGKGLKEDESSVMLENQVPDWYVNACQKIKYMFPKAHAVAYVTMAYRIAWFKVYHPLAFYASFFGIRAEDFDAETILGGYERVRQRIKDIDKMGNAATAKEKKLVTILELAMEMYVRGFSFKPVDIYKSDARKFIVEDKSLILPFSALPNVGTAAAQGIVEARKDGPFVSVEEFQVRTHLNKSAMELLRKENCFQDLPEKSQISLFG